jgi:predicted ribosome quality control (RQC) complex YloA/Tae2 family protein
MSFKRQHLLIWAFVHNNYYFLRQLSEALNVKLTGTVVSECFSQNKEELIIRFETSTTPFFIKALMDPAFSCLSFPAEFHRARKNSIDLFGELIGRRVMAVAECRNERSMIVSFSDGFTIVFKMHGNRSNVLLFDRDNIVELFRNNITADRAITLSSLHREIDFSYGTFIAHAGELQKLYYTFGKVVWSYLSAQGFDDALPDKKWQLVQDVFKKLNNPEFFICEGKQTLFLSLLETGRVQQKFNDPIAAINEFFYTYIHSNAFLREKDKQLSLWQVELESSRNFVKKTESKLKEITEDTSYKLWADLLMANLQNVPQGSERIVLADFSTEQPVEIRLKKELTPQKNAELFYKKSKNQHIEIQFLKKSIENKKSLISSLEEKIKKVSEAADLRELRRITGEPASRIQKEKKEPLPYTEFEHNSFRIWVGRNADANDSLTLKYSFKDDLWLHAKDVPGSHVLIKFQAGKKIPKDVIERAAQLAAYYSKRKNESLCPVTVTPKKFVRKRKGDPAGMVVVEREEVILVQPKS